MEITEEMLTKVKAFLAEGNTLDMACEKFGVDKATIKGLIDNVSADDLNKAAGMMSSFLGKKDETAGE